MFHLLHVIPFPRIIVVGRSLIVALSPCKATHRISSLVLILAGTTEEDVPPVPVFLLRTPSHAAWCAPGDPPQ